VVGRRRLREPHVTGVTGELTALQRADDRVPVADLRPRAGRILVLDGGAPLAQGTPREVSQDPAVVEAYLGRRAAKALKDDGDREGRDA